MALASFALRPTTPIFTHPALLAPLAAKQGSTLASGSAHLGERRLQNQLNSHFQFHKATHLQDIRLQTLGLKPEHLGFGPKAHLEWLLHQQQSQAGSRQLGEILLAKGWLSRWQLQVALAEQRQTKIDFGSLVLGKGWLNPHQLETALLEWLLQYGRSHKRRLGQILAQTRQISTWQLKEALRHKQAHEPLGKTLLRLNWLQAEQVKLALRLQKKLLRAAVLVLLSSTLLMGCQAPIVPMQPLSNQTLMTAQSAQSGQSALTGAYKTFAIETQRGKQVNMRVYQNGAKVIENVPFAIQGNDNTCGQAVITMLSKFWGIPADYQQLVDQENPLNLATVAEQIVRSLRQKGLEAQDFREASIDNLISEINKGRPTAVLLDFGSILTAHYVVIVGYNPVRNTLIMHDSLEAPYVEITSQTFLEMWENHSVRSIFPFGGDNYRRLMFQTFANKLL